MGLNLKNLYAIIESLGRFNGLITVLPLNRPEFAAQ